MAGDVEECKSEVLSELQKSYSQVFSELQTTKKVLASTLGKLSSKDLQVERLAQYNLSLRQEIEKLSEQIQKYRHPDRKDAQVQTDSEQTGPVDDDVAVSTVWNEDKEQGTTDTAVSIEDTLKATAEAVMQQTGFMYDETSGLYYDYNTNYYYDGEKSMYYDPTTGNYFYYDEADGQYVVHSQIDPARYKMYSHLIGLSKKEATNKLEADSEKRRESVKDSKKGEVRQGSELCSVETEERRRTKQKADEDDGVVNVTDQIRKLALKSTLGGCWPPCIRAIVQKSDCLDVGTLFIVTCTGGSIGRDINMNHAIVIPDNSISEIHADVYFDYDRRCYVLSDRGSESGTLLNGKQISQSGVRVTHGDVLQLGHTHVSLHIHNSSDTCDACEPGQVRSQRAKQNKPEIFFTSKEDKMRAQREQLKEIKKKYGLKNSKYVDNAAAINNPAYVDKAELRRQTVGSDVPHAKTAATASVDRPLSEDNKGHRLLAKMGWKEGQGLGKDNAGRSEPITVTVRANSSAGLGSQSNVHTSLDNVEELERCKRWFQALLRYNNINKKDNSSQN